MAGKYNYWKCSEELLRQSKIPMFIVPTKKTE